ncbi:MAG: collagen-like protein [Prosthecobacter sp.]
MKTILSLPRHNHVLANAATGHHVLANAATLSSFNPALPTDGSLVVADVLRDQFNGLAAMIAAITSVNAAVIDGVQTLLPSEQAYVMLTVTDETLHFLFGIPRGDEGVQGQNGADGAQGSPGEPGTQGAQGPQGPPFAQAVVDGVTTLNPGDPATVTVSFDGVNVHFSFGIPKGAQGEVTQAQLESAISGTSTNSNAVTTLGIVVSDPPTQAEMQQVVSKLDELITALRR